MVENYGLEKLTNYVQKGVFAIICVNIFHEHAITNFLNFH